MPVKKPVRKLKRTSARGASKDCGKNKIDRVQILQTHAANYDALMALPVVAQKVSDCLIPSPRALVYSMQQMFEMEFPQQAHRARFSYSADI